MSNIFITADTHFGHKNIFDLSPSRRVLGATSEEHDEALVSRWNAVVGNGDTVYHLGDVAFKKPVLALLARCNGIKHLVAGNHDTFPTALYLEYFKSVQGLKGIAPSVIMSHAPVALSYNDDDRWRWNIHGHCHDRASPSPQHICVSVEQTGFQPVAIEEILARCS